MSVQPLPDDAVQRPMTRSRAAKYGVSRHDLESAQWERRYQGVHSWFGRPRDDPLVRIEDASTLLLEGTALAGWAAAYLLGASDLDGIAPDGTMLPITICLQPQVQMCPRAGIVFVRSAFADDEVDVVSGIPVLGAIRTTFDLIRRAPDLSEAVAAVDAMLRQTLVDLDEVGDYVAEHTGWRGVRRARRAVALADSRSRSRAESRFRVAWAVDAGMPLPEVNVPVYSSSHGTLLGIPDLLDIESGLVGEYDGAQHRTLEHHTADNAREEVLEQHGLAVVRVTSPDLAQFRRRTVHRLKQARERGLARDRRRDRWTLERDHVI